MSSVTVTTAEGVFVFAGSRPDGGAKWTFLRQRKDGSVGPGRVPNRWKKYLKPKETKKDG